VAEMHSSHDLGLLCCEEVVKALGFAELETPTDLVHVGGVVILSDRDRDEAAFLNVHVVGEEVMIAEMGESGT